MKMEAKWFRWIWTSLCIVALSTGVSFAAGKTWTLRCSSGFTPTSHFSKEIKWYFDKVAENSDGRINVEYYYGGSLAKTGQELNALRMRSIDCAVAATGYFPAQVPLINGLNMLYVTTAVDAAMKANMEVYRKSDALRGQFENNNNAMLLWCPPVTNNTLWSTFEVPNMQALKGKKIRAYGYAGDVLTRFDATPTAIMWGDIYTSAQRGIIEGAYGTPMSLGWDSKFFEIMPYVTQTGCGVFASMAILIRKDLFDQFPADLQKVVLDWAPKAENQAVEIVTTENRKAVDDMQKRGVTFTIWSEEEIQKAAGMVQPAQYDTWIQQMEKTGMGEEASKIKNLYSEALKKFEKESTYQTAFDYWKERYGSQ